MDRHGAESVKLPRGIWYEEKYKRYRVRLYKKRVAHLAGYFKTVTAAKKAYKELKKEMKTSGKESEAG